jgi:DNA-binding SARP family transcriptional activator/TolB-like protein
MARLRTLGALGLTDSRGQTIDSILSRQRRVALLVYLAVEGHGGFLRRETLFPVFWPEMDQARARAALRQSLYILRADLGDGALVTRGAEEVGVGEALECDALLFEREATGGRPEDAMARYGGPFLHGFYIPDAPEFERWVEGRRAALTRIAAGCERTLAREAIDRGDLADAAHHYRRSLALEPTDESAVRALMSALESAGDRAAALRAYADYTELLHRDYGLEPARETTVLAEAMRDPERVTERGAGALPRSGSSEQRTSDPPTAAAALPANGQPTGISPLRSRFAMWQVAAGVVILAGVVAGSQWLSGSRDAGASEPRLVVMPFTIRAAPQIAYLGEGMADMLSTSLDGPEMYRAVPPAVVLRDVRARQSNPGEPDVARATARRFDATHFVLGSVVSAGPRVRFDAALYGPGSSPISQVTVEGDADSVFALVDRVAARLIADSRGRAPAERLRGSAALTTGSLAALRDYLSGERLLRDGAFEPSIRFFQKAVATDSTFSLAYYRLSMAWNGLGQAASALRFGVLAERHSKRLSSRDRELVTAHLAMLRGEADEAERQFRVILANNPDDAEAWLKLGEILFHSNPRRGRPISESRAPFFRVLNYDPTNRAALLHLARVAAGLRDLAEVDSLAGRYLALGVDEGKFEIETLKAAAHRDSLRIASLVAAGAGERDQAVIDAMREAFMHAGNPEAALAILGISALPARAPDRRAGAYLGKAMIELSRGRRAAANGYFRQAAAVDYPEVVRDLEIFYALHSYRPPDRTELLRMRKTLLAAGPVPVRNVQSAFITAHIALAPAIRLSLLSELSSRLGDSAAAVAYARQMEAVPVKRELEVMRQLLVGERRARLALDARQPDRALAALADPAPSDDQQPVVPAFPWNASRRWIKGDAYVADGRPRDAVRWYASFEYQSLFLYPFVAPGAMRAAAILERLGDTEGAARSYERVVTLWSGADPELRPAVDSARARLVALRPR